MDPDHLWSARRGAADRGRAAGIQEQAGSRNPGKRRPDRQHHRRPAGRILPSGARHVADCAVRRADQHPAADLGAAGDRPADVLSGWADGHLGLMDRSPARFRPAALAGRAHHPDAVQQDPGLPADDQPGDPGDLDQQRAGPRPHRLQQPVAVAADRPRRVCRRGRLRTGHL